MDKTTVAGINTALSESRLLSFDFFHEHAPIVHASFSCLQLDESFKVPPDTRVGLEFNHVTSMALSLRNSIWNDLTAEAVPVQPLELNGIIDSFGPLPI